MNGDGLMIRHKALKEIERNANLFQFFVANSYQFFLIYLIDE